MSGKSRTTPANHTRSAQQLADLATLLGLMQSASKLSEELDLLANQVGGALETMAERFGVPFGAVHQTFVAADGRDEAEGQEAAQVTVSGLSNTIRPPNRCRKAAKDQGAS